MNGELFAESLLLLPRLNEMAEKINDAERERAVAEFAFNVATDTLVKLEHEYLVMLRDFRALSPDADKFLENIFGQELWEHIQGRLKELDESEG